MSHSFDGVFNPINPRFQIGQIDAVFWILTMEQKGSIYIVKAYVADTDLNKNSVGTRIRI